MLLANMAVAHRINREFPDKALLRRHPPPSDKMLDQLVWEQEMYLFICFWLIGTNYSYLNLKYLTSIIFLIKVCQSHHLKS